MRLSRRRRSSASRRIGSSRASRIGIAFDQRPERLLERSKPRLVVAPMVEAAREDRSAHLLRTGRANGAAVAVKFKLQLRRQDAQPLNSALAQPRQIGDYSSCRRNPYPVTLMSGRRPNALESAAQLMRRRSRQQVRQAAVDGRFFTPDRTVEPGRQAGLQLRAGQSRDPGIIRWRACALA